jgi:hypothetical protein
MGHTQMGIGELVDAAEIAWKQGIDLYSELPDPQTGIPRLAEGLEFAAKILNGIAMETTCGTISKPGYGLDPMWEKSWNHYGNRTGLDLPYTKMNAERSRPEGTSWKAMYAWGTLTHSNLCDSNQVVRVVYKNPTQHSPLAATPRQYGIGYTFGECFQLNGRCVSAIFNSNSIANGIHISRHLAEKKFPAYRVFKIEKQ